MVGNDRVENYQCCKGLRRSFFCSPAEGALRTCNLSRLISPKHEISVLSVFICITGFKHWLQYLPWTCQGNLPYITILIKAIFHWSATVWGSCPRDEFQALPTSMNWSLSWWFNRIVRPHTLDFTLLSCGNQAKQRPLIILADRELGVIY